MSCLTPWDAQLSRVYDTDGAWHSLMCNGGVTGMARDAVLTIRRNKRTSRRVTEDCRIDSGKVCELANPDEMRQ